MNTHFFEGLKDQGKKIRGAVLCLGLIASLTGCNDLNSHFTCPMQPGVTCQSLDQVNTLVDQGKIAEAKPTSSGTLAAASPSIRLSTDEKSEPLGNPPLRSGETVMRLWIAPYEDHQGNYFSESMVYHVMTPNHWADESADRLRAADAVTSPLREASHV